MRRLSPRPLFTLLIALLISAFCISGCSGSDDSYPHIPPKVLKNLNTTIDRSSEFYSLKEQMLDSVKRVAAASDSPLTRWQCYVDISNSYRQTEADSAIIYAAHALGISPMLPDSVSLLPGELAFVDALSTAGIFPPALQRLDSLEHTLKSDTDKISFWKTARRCYSYIMAWVENHDYYINTYRVKYRACDDSLLNYLPEKDDFRTFISSERLVDEEHWDEARRQLEKLLERLPIESNLYGMAAYQLAMVHRHKGNFNDYATYLALAAESDIKGCVREGLALPTLAKWTFEHKDIDNAYRYMNHTLEDANSGNIRMRTQLLAPIIPLIDSAIQQKSSSSRRQLIAYVIITTTLFLATIVLLIHTFSSLKKFRQSQEKISSTSKKLESYVGNFIGLCSNYAARLDQLSKLVTRKIAAGQSDELARLISSGKFAEEDNEEFYRLIDKALLDIYPDFVSQINTLLLPDKRITLASDEPLTPELRIYAFVRLGVDQSSRIAQILGYSVNTVYAYRNRMRNRATDREKFDSLVAGMG